MITIRELKLKDFISVNYKKEREWNLVHSLFEIKSGIIMFYIETKKEPIRRESSYFKYSNLTEIISFEEETYVILKSDKVQDKTKLRILEIKFKNFSLKEKQKITKIKNQTLEYYDFNNQTYSQINFKTKSLKTIHISEKNYKGKLEHEKNKVLKKLYIKNSIINKKNSNSNIYYDFHHILECKEIKTAGDELKNGTGNILSEFE